MVRHETAPSVEELLELPDDKLAAPFSASHPVVVVVSAALESLLLLGMFRCLGDDSDMTFADGVRGVVPETERLREFAGT